MLVNNCLPPALLSLSLSLSLTLPPYCTCIGTYIHVMFVECFVKLSSPSLSHTHVRSRTYTENGFVDCFFMYGFSFPQFSVFMLRVAGVVSDVPLLCCLGGVQCYSCFHSCIRMDDWIWELLLLLCPQGFQPCKVCSGGLHF